MAVGAAALLALSAAVAAAGWLALAAIVFAGLLRAAETRPALLEGTPPVRSTFWRWAPRGVALVERTSRIALFAAVFATYLFEGSAFLAIVVFLAVVGLAEAAAVRVDTYYRRWLTGAALVAAVVFVIVCLSIAPVEGTRQADTGGVGGLLSAIVVLTVVFSGVDLPASTRLRGWSRLGVAVGAVLAVTAVAMYQIGPVRLGLSSTPLRAVLVAAEAEALLPLLAVVVALTTVPAALQECSGLREAFPETEDEWRHRLAIVLPGVVAAGALAIVLEPLACLLIAAAAGLVRVLLRAAPAARRGGGFLAPAVVTSAGALLVVLVLAVL